MGLANARGTATNIIPESVTLSGTIRTNSADIRANPRESLRNLCAALGISFTETMLRWPAGPKPFDGVWAPHWYDRVAASTGFGPPPGPAPVLNGAAAELAVRCRPYYEAMRRHAI